MVFGYDGNQNYHTENYYPYFVGGDFGSVLSPKCWTLTTGNHTVSATPYISSKGAGVARNSVSVSFSVSSGQGHNACNVPRWFVEYVVNLFRNYPHMPDWLKNMLLPILQCAAKSLALQR